MTNLFSRKDEFQTTTNDTTTNSWAFLKVGEDYMFGQNEHSSSVEDILEDAKKAGIIDYWKLSRLKDIANSGNVICCQTQKDNITGEEWHHIGVQVLGNHILDL